MANPNPARITDAMWALWTEVAPMIPGLQLGGIYANKSGYHNTVATNKARWPDDYSIRFTLDLTGPQDKARAIDWTMSPAEMTRRTGYLRRAALHPQDNRLAAMREFIGTLDGRTVYCLIRDSSGVWRYSPGRDPSHLWHIHASIYTTYCADWPRLRPIVSVLSGVTWQQWQEGEDMARAAPIILAVGGEHWICNGPWRWKIHPDRAVDVLKLWDATPIPATQLMLTQGCGRDVTELLNMEAVEAAAREGATKGVDDAFDGATVTTTIVTADPG
jgi:hypothetical protein